MQTIRLNFYIIFQSGHNISVRLSASKLSIYSGNTIAIGDYYSTTANGQAYVVKAANLAAAKSKGITPIAVIFSTTTSTIDQGHGWNRGYAMALQCATTNNGANGTCIWGPDEDSPLPNWDGENPLTTWKNNKDGYTETWKIGSNSNYPAFYYAINYKNTVAAPRTSSNWYLPSNGQAYDIFIKLGGLYETGLNVTWDNEIKIRWLAEINGIKSGIYAQEKLNQYLNAANINGGAAIYTFDFKNSSHYSAIDEGAGEYFWLSSERHSTEAYNWIIYTGDQCAWIHATAGRAKKQSYRVRTVLAF